MSGDLLANQPKATELIVRFKPGVSMAENLDEVIRSVNDGKHEALKKRLSNPINVRPFLNSYNRSHRKSQALAKAIKKSPRELLDEYIVLSYTDNKALQRAKALLKKDGDVLWIGENGYATLSAVPNDPLNNAVVVGPADESEYQWALYALNMHEAWDYSTGHAYVSMVDFGIQTDHPDILKNFRDQFSARIVSYQERDRDDNIEDNYVLPSKSSHDVDEVSVLKSYYDPYYGSFDDFENSHIRVGHGMHVAGIMAAEQNNGIGVTGICGNCSLMTNHTGVGKTKYESEGEDVIKIIYTGLHVDSLANNIIWLTDTGAQLINMSLGGSPHPAYAPENGCSGKTQVNGTWVSNGELYPMCIAISHADAYDVVMVAATGNAGATSIHFPASDPRVIAVGAVDSSMSKTTWSNSGPEIDLAAPGENILSTVYTDKFWLKDDGNEATFTPNCGDEFSALSGYGPCSGTSMATPHVTGIAAILRSINPLLTKSQIKELLTGHASQAGDRDDAIGYGVPNAAESVKAAMGTVNGEVLQNRLTPLFSLYSSDAEDYLYTTVPQMAMAAIYNSLRPQPGSSYFEKPDNPVLWRSKGSKTSGYTSFPYITWMPSEPPKASVYIFTTNDNPLVDGEQNQEDQGNRLVPLYRLSYQGTKGSNTRNIDHTYATSQAEITFFKNNNYNLDGIEGYIYPRSINIDIDGDGTGDGPPAGTVKLYRSYNSNRYDHAIFPESELASMQDDYYYGEEGVADWIGYVYPNQDSDGDSLIDGFEFVIGTDSTNPDTDGDGTRDGLEVMTYYTDPLDN
jgi:subtilisin family serine protease